MINSISILKTILDQTMQLTIVHPEQFMKSFHATLTYPNFVRYAGSTIAHLDISNNHYNLDDLTVIMTLCILHISYQLSIITLSKLILHISNLYHISDKKSDLSPFSVHTVANVNNNALLDKDLCPLVVNLSNYVLTTPQYNLLKRGLKFCPNPGEPDLSSYQTDLDKFHLRLKRFLHFYRPKNRNVENDILTQTDIASNSTISEEPFQHQTFKNPSAWTPPPVAPLEFFITKNSLDLAECKLPRVGRQNIPHSESRAIKELSNNRNIVIKPADKGGAVVIWDRQDYIKEGIRQLSDRTFYIETEEDLTPVHHKQIVDILDTMLTDDQIHRSCHAYLSDSKIRTAQFYMLPKIHKNNKHPPGRPIVSGNGCPTERISQFVDFFLQPCVKKIDSYIKDTTDFLSMLKQTGQLPPGCLLVTLDVASLYTNIPNVEGCQATLYSLNHSRNPLEKPHNHYLLQLLEKVLTCNNFDFDGKHYLQVGGTAMGTKVAPAYANTFMGWYEDTYVYTYHKQPLLWKRFIDDIFVIWSQGEDELRLFINHLNNSMPSIKFEAETSRTEVHFLDVTLKLDQNGIISTTLYTKPTDSHNYVNYQSCHPRSCKNGIPYGPFYPSQTNL